MNPARQKSSGEIDKAVILARGLGKRMRAEDSAAALSSEQAHVAETGMKAMIPIGRPFLDYVLSALADAGYRKACLIVGPEHDAIRKYYQKLSPSRIAVCFAVQEKPIGTADAVLAAREFVAEDSFLVLNSDNYYPVEIFEALRVLGEPGLPAFERNFLLREGNISEDRIKNYALLEADEQGYLKRIREKPKEMPAAGASGEVLISMNCWRFDTAIFRACEQVQPSPRGELELPGAVQYGIETLGLRFRLIRFRAGVLDLSYRSDISSVAERLAGIKVVL